MSFRSIGGNEWRDMGTTGQGRSGPAETKGFPTMHSGSMYGKVEHESGYGRRSGFGVGLQNQSELRLCFALPFCLHPSPVRTPFRQTVLCSVGIWHGSHRRWRY